MELDARNAAPGAMLDADLCIVGAGPVGLALADALRESGLQVVIIESGGCELDPEADELNGGDAIGDPYRPLQTSRSRGAGGTAAIWNTMVRGTIGAKYLPLDDIDFEARAEVPGGGWPFGREHLDPYYRRAQAVCGLGPFDYAAPGWSNGDLPLLDLRDSMLTSGVYQCGHADVFRGTIWRRLLDSTRVMVVHRATATELIRTSPGGRVAEMRWATLAGGQGGVRAARFVLAAGGIENARILLLSARSSGNRAPVNDWIGRGFMEHPIDGSLELVSRAPALTGESSFYMPHAADGAPAVMGRIALSPELLRELRVPNASVRLGEAKEPQLLQSAVTRLAARRLIPFQAARRMVGNSIRRVAAARDRFQGNRYQLLIDLEQPPHRDNRVVLSDRCDRFGQPRAQLHWRWRDEDERGRVKVRDAIARGLERAGVGRTALNPNHLLDPNAHHHSGTTRIHTDPREGVVDERLRVHGEENLYVVGSSVFPTAGFANPTLTAVALALRLADHLGCC